MLDGSKATQRPLFKAPKLPRKQPKGGPLKVAGLFAGIGGIEHGLHRAGHQTEFLCEFEPRAAKVLNIQLGCEVAGDVQKVMARDIPPVDLLAGGFPCQDLSQAGRTAGITGERSGLVGEMIRLLESMCPTPKWVLFENVTFMLRLDQGQAMRFLTETLSELGYIWAYRIVDTRAFGLPQRRQRVIFLASKQYDPRPVLFADEAGPEPDLDGENVGYGFYWTEGIRGLGWAPGAVPTLKGGSTVGIPSPPAIWMPDGRVVTPDIRDAERLQGFSPNWTRPGVEDLARKDGPRWKMVGNAVSVPVAEWVGERLAGPGSPDVEYEPLAPGSPWPNAAWGYANGCWEAMGLSLWPVRRPMTPIHEFLKYAANDLSLRATVGFRARTKRSSLRFRKEFLDAIDTHIERMGGDPKTVGPDSGRRKGSIATCSTLFERAET